MCSITKARNVKYTYPHTHRGLTDGCTCLYFPELLTGRTDLQAIMQAEAENGGCIVFNSGKTKCSGNIYFQA